MSEIKFGFSAPEIIEAGHVSDDDLHLLKRWQRETDLPQLTDEQLVLFLIAAGSSVELCKATIDAHFRIKTKNPVLFKDRNVQNGDLRKIASVMHFAVMPERYGGSTLFFSGLNDRNYRNLDFACFLRMNCLIAEAILQDNNPQDVIYTFDCRGTTFMHAWKINMHLLKVYLDYIQQGLPCQVKNVHFLHSNRVMHVTYNIIKPWFGQGILSKIVLHSSEESTNGFYEWIPRRYLPKEFGGDLKSIRVYHDRTIKKLEDLQFYFDAEQELWLQN
ncbi:hypothetical protein PPYR_03191 [Photinus pyralis]|uniref:CRAL-TRIO domain-containing protein n=1 Tax=Photinus pyralis TaxID=7054 RepID=A0A5N4A267_PHOPY|nr:retinaldehyde-binding protein 1-like [Photinus pyralis]KAB0791391.1 hypothetical protein PPYR_03191 [Photinus pyralis]